MPGAAPTTREADDRTDAVTHTETCGMCDGARWIGGTPCQGCGGEGTVIVAGPDPGASDDPADADA